MERPPWVWFKEAYISFKCKEMGKSLPGKQYANCLYHNPYLANCLYHNPYLANSLYHNPWSSATILVLLGKS